MPKTHPLRAYRKKHKLKLAEFAATLKISPVTLVSYENGNRLITAERAVSIEKRAGIDRSILRPDIFRKAA